MGILNAVNLSNEKNKLLLIFGSVAIIGYLLGLFFNLGANISTLTVTYLFLIVICCVYYKFKQISEKAWNSVLIIAIFSTLLGSFTHDEVKAQLLAVPAISVLFFGLVLRFKHLLQANFKAFKTYETTDYSLHHIVLPVTTVVGFILLGLTAIFMIQTNSVYTLFMGILMGINLVSFTITLTGSLINLALNEDPKIICTSSYVAIFSLFGMLVSHNYFLQI